MQLQFDNKSDIPTDSADSFVEFEQEGKTVYMHKDLAESKKTSFRFQGQVTNLQKDFDGFKGKISQDQITASELAEKNQKDAIAAKIAELNKGEDNHSEVHKLELQQQSDKYQSLSDKNEKLQESFDGLQKSLVEKENRNYAISIASQFTIPDQVDSLSKLLILDHIKSVDGKSIFTDASGNAVDDDLARILEVLNKNPQLKHFGGFPNSKGGFGGKGGSSENDGKIISRKDYEAKNPAEKASLMEKGVTLID